jgi:hypothetical protein
MGIQWVEPRDAANSLTGLAQDLTPAKTAPVPNVNKAKAKNQDLRPPLLEFATRA